MKVNVESLSRREYRLLDSISKKTNNPSKSLFKKYFGEQTKRNIPIDKEYIDVFMAMYDREFEEGNIMYKYFVIKDNEYILKVLTTVHEFITHIIIKNYDYLEDRCGVPVFG
jgi:hypothetical protein